MDHDVGAGNPVEPFAARKLCHAGCGLGIMLLDSTDYGSRLFVWTVAFGSIAMTWNLSRSPLSAFPGRRTWA